MAKKIDPIQSITGQNFLYPVGSVEVSKAQSFEKNLYASLSANNPYLASLQTTNNKDQSDWLMKQALDYEASQQASITKAQLDYALLQEQREYDLPINEIARMRDAGINPDVQNSSGVGSSSGSAPISGQNISTASNASTTPSERVSMRCNAVASMLGSFTQLGHSIVSSVDTLSTIPGRRALVDSQANLAQSILPSAVQQASNSATSGQIANAQQQLNLIGGLSEYFTPDSTDEDFSSVLSLLGYSGDSVDSLRDSVRTYFKNPKLQKSYLDSKTAKAKSEEFANSYSIKIYGEAVALQQKVEYDNLRLEDLQTNLQTSFNSYLADAGYSTLSAQNLIDSQKLSSEQIALSRQKLEQDLRAYTSYIYNLAQYSAHSQDVIDSVRSNAYEIDPKTGKKTTKQRSLTVDEQRIIDSESLKQLMVGMLGSHHMQTLINMYNHSSHLKYVMGEYILPAGDVNPLPTSEARIRFEDYTFNMLVDNASAGTATAESFFDSFIGMIPFVGNVMLKSSNNATKRK